MKCPKCKAKMLGFSTNNYSEDRGNYKVNFYDCPKCDHKVRSE